MITLRLPPMYWWPNCAARYLFNISAYTLFKHKLIF